MLALALALTALPLTGVDEVAAPQTVVVMPLEANAVAESDVKTLDGRLVRLLSERADLKVIDPKDIQRFIDLQSERAAAGLKCDDESCLNEIANALGAQRILYGVVGKLGMTYSLQLNLFDADSGRSVARTERSGLLIETVGGRLLEEAIGELMGDEVAEERPHHSLPREVRPGPRVLFWGGVTVATIGALAATGLGVEALLLDAQLGATDGSVPRRDKEFARDTGWVFGVGAILSGVLAGTGATLALIGATE